MSSIDLTSQNITVPAQFRIAIEFQHAGLPSVARDDDGNIIASRNFVFLDLGASNQWFLSQTVGLVGDWIIRATVADLTPEIFANGFE